MKKYSLVLVFLLAVLSYSYGQKTFDRAEFYADKNPLVVNLSTDIGNLMSGKIKNQKQEGIFTCTLRDTNAINARVEINLRGNMRRSYCKMPPLKLHFIKDSASELAPLSSVKLVPSCGFSKDYEQLVLKEYLLYKMYNLLTDKSFKVRLLLLTYDDSKKKKKPFTQYAFFIEDADQMAKRNKCLVAADNQKFLTDATDNRQITLTCLFQYMIGNTDFSVPNNHNIKIIKSKKDTTSKPYAVPYDFDYSGIVNADYAIPNESLGLENVTQRMYRGFPRTMSELNPLLQIFKEQKANIYALIEDCKPLEEYNKKQMTDYLDDFFKMIDKPSEVKSAFIDNARRF
ncbi:hypothetical protein BH10BAC3_BH10BAC3_34840 [soil metagenome]